MTEEEAFEEVVCDACQRMLLDTNAGQKLAEFGAQSEQNRSFLKKLKQQITALLDKLRSYFKNVDPDSRAAKEFQKFDQRTKQILADMFVDMNRDAGEKLSTIQAAGMAEKNTTDEGGVRYSLVVKRTNGTSTLEDPSKISREKTLDYLLQSRKGQLDNNSYFPVKKSTPQIIISSLRNADIDITDRPLAMQASKARQSQIEGKPIRKDGVTIRFHAMSAEKILEVIDNLDQATAIIHQRERKKTIVVDGERIAIDAPDNFAIFVTLQDGKEYVAIIEFDSYIDEKYIVKDGHDDKYHTTVTVFEPDVIRDGEPFDYIEYLLMRGTNREIDVKKESTKTETAYSETDATVSEKELSDTRITQPKAVVNPNSTTDSDSPHKLPIGEDISPRALLANAAESVAQNEMERVKLRDYQEKAAELDAQEQKLHDLRAQIKELSFAKGPRDKGKLKELQLEAQKTVNRINIMDKQLLRIEAFKPLQDLLAREKAAAEERAKERVAAALAQMRKEYGTIPKGENAVREDALPVSTDGKNKVSRTARTVKGAAVTPDEFAGLIDTEVAKGELTYLPISNDETSQKAAAWVEKLGWAAALAEWYRDVGSGKTGADIVARGAVLLNNAAQAGDRDTWREILFNYQLLGTHTAQGLQAMRILKKLSLFNYPLLKALGRINELPRVILYKSLTKSRRFSDMLSISDTYYIKKYSASVSSALFLSSSRSPAINRSSSMISRSPVSMSFGSSCLKNPIMPS